MVHTFNPSTWEAEAGGSLSVQGQADLQSKFQDSQGYTETPCLGEEGTEGELFTQTQGAYQTSSIRTCLLIYLRNSH